VVFFDVGDVGVGHSTGRLGGSSDKPIGKKHACYERLRENSSHGETRISSVRRFGTAGTDESSHGETFASPVRRFGGGQKRKSVSPVRQIRRNAHTLFNCYLLTIHTYIYTYRLVKDIYDIISSKDIYLCKR
jgi:hypothetical protein